MKIDRPVAIFAHPVAHLGANVAHSGNTFARVVDGVDRDRERIKPIETVSRLDRQASTVLERGVASNAGNHPRRVVALAEVTGLSAEKLMHGHAESFAFDVPQRKIYGSDGAGPLAPGRIKVGAIHI